MTYPSTKNPTKSKLIDRVRFEKYFQAETWEDYNRQFFDGLAAKYDLSKKIISWGFHDSFIREALDRIPYSPFRKALDLCTGTGDIAIALAKRDPEIEIQAVDVADKMLALGQIKSQNLKLQQRIEFRKTDVLKLPFEDGSFDLVVICFGLRNLSSVPEAVREFHRVTKPGGIFVNIDFSKPPDRWRKLIYKVYFQNLVPLAGKLFHRNGEMNSFEYVAASNEFFPLPDELVKMYTECGFSNPKVYEYMLGGVSQQIVWKK